jgi:ferrochelatase
MSDLPGKTAVVLFNLGSPQSEKDIEPFLYRFFMDPHIIDAPLWVRWLVAKKISITRSRGAARDAYRHLNFKSPLLENTRQQAAALERALRETGADARCFVSMRYWDPLAKEVTRALKEYQPDQIVLLPLYPQYSTTTTGSSFDNFWDEAEAAGMDEIKATTIKDYPTQWGFIEASAIQIDTELKKAPPKTRLLLSAHGLPQRTIAKGDPYQRQCEETAAAIAARLQQVGWRNLDWQLCYQSRIGPLEWIGPSIGTALEKAAADKVAVVVYPLSFVSENVETLVELDIEYKDRAAQLSLPAYLRAPTVGTHPLFIEGLRDLVLSCGGGKT